MDADKLILIYAEVMDSREFVRSFVRIIYVINRLDHGKDNLKNLTGWKDMTLSEACKLIVDCPHSTPSYTNDGPMSRFSTS